jgi:acyl-coenzyme A synthetase/AMP-(fatty) acid ligase
VDEAAVEDVEALAEAAVVTVEDEGVSQEVVAEVSLISPRSSIYTAIEHSTSRQSLCPLHAHSRNTSS